MIFFSFLNQSSLLSLLNQRYNEEIFPFSYFLRIYDDTGTVYTKTSIKRALDKRLYVLSQNTSCSLVMNSCQFPYTITFVMFHIKLIYIVMKDVTPINIIHGY